MTTTPIPRRDVLAAGGALLGAAMLAETAQAQMPSSSSAPFALPQLPYAFNALEPHIDAATMEIHHGKHHAAYVSALNIALKEQPRMAGQKLEDILARLADAPDNIRAALRNNGGGHANHAMFWQIMGGRGGDPTGPLAQAIQRDFGSFERFRADFNGAGLRLFGSGWVFVTVDRDGRLAVTTRPNQDTPLMEGQRVLMGNDVWEHAYYLKYNNRRAEYLAGWWNVLDWNRLNERYAAARAGTLGI
ncbi:superoxide dismutase [Roseomonas sp. GC11]|uniref:superoxide dismutase n=1 Tax=Roseomonas sp. GC11 TaxID=2950546 RepID=UPI00351E6206